MLKCKILPEICKIDWCTLGYFGPQTIHWVKFSMAVAATMSENIKIAYPDRHDEILENPEL